MKLPLSKPVRLIRTTFMLACVRHRGGSTSRSPSVHEAMQPDTGRSIDIPPTPPTGPAMPSSPCSPFLSFDSALPAAALAAHGDSLLSGSPLPEAGDAPAHGFVTDGFRAAMAITTPWLHYAAAAAASPSATPDAQGKQRSQTCLTFTNRRKP